MIAITHPDLQALIAGVLADPSSELPTLVLADFLEENGDPRGPWLRVLPRARERMRAIEPVWDVRMFGHRIGEGCLRAEPTEWKNDWVDADGVVYPAEEMVAKRWIPGWGDSGRVRLREAGCNFPSVKWNREFFKIQSLARLYGIALFWEYRQVIEDLRGVGVFRAAELKACRLIVNGDCSWKKLRSAALVPHLSSYSDLIFGGSGPRCSQVGIGLGMHHQFFWDEAKSGWVAGWNRHPWDWLGRCWQVYDAVIESAAIAYQQTKHQSDELRGCPSGQRIPYIK